MTKMACVITTTISTAPVKSHYHGIDAKTTSDDKDRSLQRHTINCPLQGVVLAASRHNPTHSVDSIVTTQVCASHYIALYIWKLLRIPSVTKQYCQAE